MQPSLSFLYSCLCFRQTFGKCVCFSPHPGIHPVQSHRLNVSLKATTVLHPSEMAFLKGPDPPSLNFYTCWIAFSLWTIFETKIYLFKMPAQPFVSRSSLLSIIEVEVGQQKRSITCCPVGSDTCLATRYSYFRRGCRILCLQINYLLSFFSVTSLK